MDERSFDRIQKFGIVFAAAILALFSPRPRAVEEPELGAHGNRSSLPYGQYLAFGHGTFFSSILWVNTMIRYADVLVDGRSGVVLPSMMKLTSDLDTMWHHPRLLAAWMIPDLKGYSEKDAIPFLMDGAHRFPDKFQFRLVWAQYVMASPELDSLVARDSASQILLPLSRSSAQVPSYARDLAFTLLHKSGKPEEAMDILLQTYAQVPDPLVRFQFQNKIADLLERNKVSLGASDSTAFFHAIGGMLDSKDPSQVGMAKGLLVRLVQPEHKTSALAEAHQLAEQFKAYQKQAAAAR